MNKKLAHIILFFFDLICLFGLWYFYDEIRQILLDIRSQANTVGFNSKQGFFIFALGMPIIHIVIAIEHFWFDFVNKHMRLINYGLIAGLILLFISAFVFSAVIQVKVENAGYMNCKPLEWLLRSYNLS